MSKCSNDFYLDPGSGTCQPCDELCHQATVRGTVERCRKYCPVGVGAPVTDVPIDQVTHFVTPAYEQSTINLNSDSSPGAQYAVVILAVLIILISIMAFAVLLKRAITSFLHGRNTKETHRNPRTTWSCQRDYYYDGDTRDCRSYAYLCHQAEVHGRLKKCQDLCPVEDANEKAVTVTENFKSSSATLVIPDGITVQDASPHAVAIVCLMSFFLAVILLVAVVAFWRWKQRQTNRGPVRYDNRDIQTTEDDTEETLMGEQTSSV